MIVERHYSSEYADWETVADFLIEFILRLIEK